MTNNLTQILSLLPLLIPILLLELGLMIFALVNIITRKQVRGGNKVVWILVVVLIQIIGPIVYFAFGRKEEIVDGDKN
jgi:hypothetical protein